MNKHKGTEIHFKQTHTPLLNMKCLKMRQFPVKRWRYVTTATGDTTTGFSPVNVFEVISSFAILHHPPWLTGTTQNTPCPRRWELFYHPYPLNIHVFAPRTSPQTGLRNHKPFVDQSERLFWSRVGSYTLATQVCSNRLV